MRASSSTTREVDRFSTILGQPARIMQPLGTPKPREECQPFTITLHDPNASGNYPHISRSRGRNVVKSKRYGPEDNRKLQEKAMKVVAREAKRAAK